MPGRFPRWSPVSSSSTSCLDRARSLTRRKVRLYMANQIPAASDWGAGRGEKWRAQLTGMEAMLAPVDPVLIQALHLDAPYRIADVACGGGGTTLEILRRAPANTIVHGFDISPTLIEVA